MTFYSAMIKNEILPFAATWMDLESIMLSENVRQRKTNTVGYLLYLESKKIQLVNITKKKLTHRYREQTSGNEEREAGRENMG